jgi:transcriptional regulator with XRE-family HTH domain
VAEVSQGALINRWRNQRGMIQRDVAEALNVSQSTISAWERDRWRVPTSKVRPLCHAIGGGADELKAAIKITEFEEDDPAITDSTDIAISGSAETAILELEQELDRFRSINDQLALYVERIAKLEPILQRLEKSRR